MPDLATFQRMFAEALLAEQSVGAIESQPGLAVYRNTCARGVVEALRAAYPTVNALVGDEAFTATALDFRALNPPRSPVLSDYGRTFPDFLARQPWTSELPYLADVAHLDRLWLASFLARDVGAPTSLNSVGGTTRVMLHPATRFGWVTTPAMTIWQAHREPGGCGELEPEWRQEGALFTRRGDCVHAEQIDRACCLLLATCSAGVGMSDSIAVVQGTYPQADAGDLIARLLGAGALTIH